MDPISFAQTPTLTGERVTLTALGPEHVDAWMAVLDDPQVDRLTGTHATFTRAQIAQHCATRREHDDRLDYAILEDGAFVGELAILDLDVHNRSCAFRIALASHATGRGLGTEATRLIVQHVLGLGIHRIGLDVYAHNPRARHVYEKLGFVHEGTLRDALLWEGEWIDAHVMALIA